MNGEEFLNKLYNDLRLSENVLRVSNKSDTPKEGIYKYMNRLESIHEKADTQSKKNIILKYYYDKYVIKRDRLQYFSSEDQDRIIKTQQESLKSWISYLTDDNARYPMWAKYWVFQGMLKIGKYNEASDTYGKRSSSTIAPFIEMNPEIVAKCISNIREYVDEKKITDESIKELIERGNFQKMYVLLLKKIKQVKAAESGTDGKWIKYNYGSEEDAGKLYDSLQGYNTGWCTAGDFETAKEQVCGECYYSGGDFYVYYTKDENGEYKFPRVAIRMDGTTEIGEIRGIDESQNLEEGFEEIVEQKLNSIIFLEEKSKKKAMLSVEDARRLTRLNKQKDLITDNDDIRFIYELDRYIEGFGWSEDPRIEKIQHKTKTADINLLCEIAKTNEVILKNASDGLKNDRKLMLEIVKQNGDALEFVSDELKNDRKIVLTAVNQNWSALKYASDELKNNREIVVEAIKNENCAINWIMEYIGDYLKHDKKFMLEAIYQNWRAIEYIGEELKNNKEFIISAVNINWRSLKYASEELKNNREIVLAAVNQDGRALEYASDELKNDREIVFLSLRKGRYAFYYAGEEIKNDRDFILKIVRQNGNVIEYASEKLKNDRELVLEAVKNDIHAMRFASEELKNNKEFMLTIIKKNPAAIRYASEGLQHDSNFLQEITRIISNKNHEETKIDFQDGRR